MTRPRLEPRAARLRAMAVAHCRLERDVRLPVRVAIVLLDEVRDRRERVVIELGPHPTGLALDDDMLVHLDVAAFGLFAGQPFEPAVTMLEQPQVPVRVVRVPQPATHEEEAPVDPVAAYRRGIGLHQPADLDVRVGRQHFVGVEQQHPVVPERDVLERPVLLLRPRPFLIELDHARAVPLRDLHRVVIAVRVDDHDLVGPGDRLEAAGELVPLVLHRNDDRDRNRRRAN